MRRRGVGHNSTLVLLEGRVNSTLVLLEGRVRNVFR